MILNNFKKSIIPLLFALLLVSGIIALLLFSINIVQNDKTSGSDTKNEITANVTETKGIELAVVALTDEPTGAKAITITANVTPVYANDVQIVWSLNGVVIEGFGGNDVNGLMWTIAEDTKSITIERVGWFTTQNVVTATLKNDRTKFATCTIDAYKHVTDLEIANLTYSDNSTTTENLEFDITEDFGTVSDTWNFSVEMTLNSEFTALMTTEANSLNVGSWFDFTEYGWAMFDYPGTSSWGLNKVGLNTIFTPNSILYSDKTVASNYLEAIFKNCVVKYPTVAPFSAYIEASSVNAGFEFNLQNVLIKVNPLDIEVNNVIGNNLLPSNYFNGENHTHNGITYVVNDDGTVTANGTATEMSRYYFARDFELSPGTYTLSGCPGNGTYQTYKIQIYTPGKDTADIGLGKTITITETLLFSIDIVIQQNITVSNLIFKPMLNVGSTALPYEQYQINTIPTDRNQYAYNLKLYGNSEIKDGEITSVGDLVTNTESSYYGMYAVKIVSQSMMDSSISETATVYLDAPLRSVGKYTDYIDIENGKVIRNVGYIESYNGETISTKYLSSSGELSNGAQVIYGLSSSTQTALSTAQKTALEAITFYSTAMRISNDNTVQGSMTINVTLKEIIATPTSITLPTIKF